MRLSRSRAVVAIVALLAAGVRGEDTPKGEKVERYPPSWRLQVQASIERGVQRLRALQAPEGHWGNPKDLHAMGHTALPLLALLKAGVPPDDEAVQRAFAFLRPMLMTTTYGVGCRLMTVHALYHPTLDTFDTDVGAERAKHANPEEVRTRLSESDLALLGSGLRFLRSAQADNGLWHYQVQPGPARGGYDLSNTQYALLGLRAIADCGVEVPFEVWQAAFRGLLTLQEREGPAVDLRGAEVRDGYAYALRERALARGFRYKLDVKDGPLGKGTVFTQPATGSMTCSGIACLQICAEGMWRSRRFGGRDRKAAQDAVRDGLAWLQEHFTVTTNPGTEKGENRLYYLYGLERAAMLTSRRWIGTHDWYKEGADALLAEQLDHGGWEATHEPTSFAILFLKRATQPPPQLTTRDD